MLSMPSARSYLYTGPNVDTLDRVSTFNDPISVRLDRLDDSAFRQFADTLAAHGLACRVTVATHDQGGLLDVVATRDDLPLPPVEVVDVGLSDHRLLRWTTSHTKPSPVYTTRTSWPWRHLDS